METYPCKSSLVCVNTKKRRLWKLSRRFKMGARICLLYDGFFLLPSSGRSFHIYETWCLANTRREIPAPTPHDEADWAVNSAFAQQWKPQWGAFKRPSGLAPARWRGLAPTSSNLSKTKPETSWQTEKFRAFCLQWFPAIFTPYANFTPNDAMICAEQKECCSGLVEKLRGW